MSTATEAEFARMHGVSREAVRKWKERAQIVMTGDLVDVERSDERLRRGGRGRFTQSAKRLARRSHPATRQPGDWTPEETYQHARTHRAAMVLSVHVGSGGDLAHLLVQHLPIATVRPLVERYVAASRADAVESLDEQGNLPVGLATWADHPWFLEPPLTDAEWAELAAEVEG